jgi:hypothetical protein
MDRAFGTFTCSTAVGVCVLSVFIGYAYVPRRQECTAVGHENQAAPNPDVWNPKPSDPQGEDQELQAEVSDPV